MPRAVQAGIFNNWVLTQYVRHYQWVKTIKALPQVVNRLPSLTSRKSANNYRFSVCITDTVHWDKFTIFCHHG